MAKFKWNRNKLKVVGVLIGLVILGGALYVINQRQSSNEKVLHVTIPGQIMTLDPTMITDTNSARATVQVEEALYRYNQKGKIVPGVAEKIVKPTNDGKTYTFTLRKDAKWSDGSPVTATDFVTAMQRQADPKSGSQATKNYQDIANFTEVLAGKKSMVKLGIKALSQHKLQITLATPVPNIEASFAAKYYPLSTKAIKRWGKQYGTDAKHTLYNGAYIVSGWNGTNNEWHYLKNDHYWQAAKVAKIKTINVQYIKESSTAELAFRKGDVQETAVSAEFAKKYASSSELHTALVARTQALFFNDQDNKVNQDLRTAFNLLLNRQQLATEILADGSRGATGWVPEGEMSYQGQDFSKTAGNQTKANLNKAKAAWHSYLQSIGQHAVSLTLTMDNVNPDMKVATYIQQVAQKEFSGLTLDLKAVEHAQSVNALLSQQYQLDLAGWSSDWPDAADFLDLLTSDSAMNFQKIQDGQFDQLMAQAAQQVTQPKARWQTLQAAQKRLASQSEIVPLYQSAKAYMISKKLTGLRYTPFVGSQYQYATWR
jgi:peptide/nickel transport system substrate-binding protein/oligopeptide transport system substrate-binding protein